jgi:hypothetical protein
MLCSTKFSDGRSIVNPQILNGVPIFELPDKEERQVLALQVSVRQFRRSSAELIRPAELEIEELLHRMGEMEESLGTIAKTVGIKKRR